MPVSCCLDPHTCIIGSLRKVNGKKTKNEKHFEAIWNFQKRKIYIVLL